MAGPISTDLIRGHTDTIILNILRQGDSYGYGIFKQIIELSGNRYQLKEATLYTAFRRLEGENLISSYWGDETQRAIVYRITDAEGNTSSGPKSGSYKDILDKMIKGSLRVLSREKNYLNSVPQVAIVVSWPISKKS